MTSEINTSADSKDRDIIREVAGFVIFFMDSGSDHWIVLFSRIVDCGVMLADPNDVFKV